MVRGSSASLIPRPCMGTRLVGMFTLADTTDLASLVLRPSPVTCAVDPSAKAFRKPPPSTLGDRIPWVEKVMWTSGSCSRVRLQRG